MHYYKSYGLIIRSEFLLPELQVTCDQEFHVDVVHREIKEDLPEANIRTREVQISQSCCQLNISGVARIRVSNGSRVDVFPMKMWRSTADQAAREMRAYLLGSAMGIVLHQRRILPLHVSAIETPAGVWAFTGPSGAGKSTIAAWLHLTQGWPMLSDDVAAVTSSTGGVSISPGPVRVKLWRDALAKFGIETSGLQKDLVRVDKFHLDLRDRFLSEPRSLQGIILLSQSSESESSVLSRLSGSGYFRTLFSSIYRPIHAIHIRQQSDLLEQISEMSRNLEIYRFTRVWDLGAMDDSMEMLMKFFHKRAETGAPTAPVL